MIGTVDLPWPDRRLHPNARVNWFRKAAAAKRARLDAGGLTRQAGLRKIDADALHVTITFHPPDKRRRDQDGMLSAIKSHLDGIADVVGVDDSRWRFSIDRGEPVKGGAVRVTIEPEEYSTTDARAVDSIAMGVAGK